jgi:putative PIN family toxin of toxin-antitoxin system
MIRAVVDTNVYISAFMFGGLPGALLDLILLRSFDTLISPVLLDELDEKLRLKFKVSPSEAAVIRERIKVVAHLVKPNEALSIVADDPDDDRVLECAVAGKADYIVTGDKHLLALRSFRDIDIVSVRQFMDSLEPDNE